ncbi:hypothetical protein [Micromonospora endolithica]|uniref:Serine protease n=1 Tax=Micromonospora endolithica TaxID=230091 RepID=A0A3A9YT11_9ACTN|nr:hypothetical protein [Micromonospora endolithica]RKN38427.1 hypothetical protein D7223_30945 [Micromonospora endolithica]TWJ23157.1 hypothetical protein JD76_03287 [Micromonospora endolithica]
MNLRRRTCWAATAVAVLGIVGLAAVPAHADDIEVVDAEVTVPATGTNCEAAFVVKNYGGAPGTVGLISAGHCDTPGHQLISSNADADFEVVGTGYNVIGTTSLPNGAELYSANFFRANWANKSTWVSYDRSNTVNPQVIGGAFVGMPVCRFGGVTPHACGTVQSTNVAPRGAGFAADTFGFLRLNIPCVGGDSGAAVLSADGTQAIGIVSGRRLSDGACIVSQLNRVGPKVGGLELYQPPAPGSLYQVITQINGTWYNLGVPVRRDPSADPNTTPGQCDRFLRAGGVTSKPQVRMGCVPV